MTTDELDELIAAANRDLWGTYEVDNPRAQQILDSILERQIAILKAYKETRND